MWAGLPAGHQRGLEPWHNHWILSKGRQGLQVGVWTGARLSTQSLDPGAVTEPRTMGRRQFSRTNEMVRDENVQNVTVFDAGHGHTGAYVRRNSCGTATKVCAKTSCKSCSTSCEQFSTHAHVSAGPGLSCSAPTSDFGSVTGSGQASFLPGTVRPRTRDLGRKAREHRAC